MKKFRLPSLSINPCRYGASFAEIDFPNRATFMASGIKYKSGGKDSPIFLKSPNSPIWEP
jgi:hypothetical protein